MIEQLERKKKSELIELKQLEPEILRAIVQIGGMTCSTCPNAIRKMLQQLDGISNEYVNYYLL